MNNNNQGKGDGLGSPKRDWNCLCYNRWVQPKECVLSNEARWWISNFNHDSLHGEMNLRSSHWMFRLRFLVSNSIGSFCVLRLVLFDCTFPSMIFFIFFIRNVRKYWEQTFSGESIRQRFSLLFNPVDKWIKLNILEIEKSLTNDAINSLQLNHVLRILKSILLWNLLC